MDSKYPCHIFFNGGIDVDVIKVTQDTSLSFATAIEQKDRIVNKETTTLFNTFDENLDMKYNPPVKDAQALSTVSIYRQNPGQTYWNFICTLEQGKIHFYDYNIVNDEYYHYLAAIQRQTVDGPQYELYENKMNDLDNGPSVFHRARWKTWSITNIRESETIPNTYEQFGYVWNLDCNIESEDVTQNTSVTSWDTLGRFPKISVGKKNYDSMTFTGLLGNVMEYTKIGEKTVINGGIPKTEYTFEKKYGYTERFADNANLDKEPKDGDMLQNYPNINKYPSADYTEFATVRYANEMEKLLAWKEFVNDGNLKLLKDLKGNSWIVMITENPNFKIDNRPFCAPTTVSFQWQEVEDIANNAIVNLVDS